MLDLLEYWRERLFGGEQMEEEQSELLAAQREYWRELASKRAKLMNGMPCFVELWWQKIFGDWDREKILEEMKVVKRKAWHLQIEGGGEVWEPELLERKWEFLRMMARKKLQVM
jgi:hypothetical protein